MYATTAFDFTQGDNGWLMASFAGMRSIFLVLIFPRVIGWGRRFVANRRSEPAITNAEAESPTSEASRLLPTEPAQFEAPTGAQIVEEPVISPKKQDQAGDTRFDLIFLRWSLMVDGLLTTISAFATQPWHIYLGKSFRTRMSLICRNRLTCTSCRCPSFWIRFCRCRKGCHHENVPRFATSRRVEPCNLGGKHCTTLYSGIIRFRFCQPGWRRKGICHLFL